MSSALAAAGLLERLLERDLLRDLERDLERLLEPDLEREDDRDDAERSRWMKATGLTKEDMNTVTNLVSFFLSSSTTGN